MIKTKKTLTLIKIEKGDNDRQHQITVKKLKHITKSNICRFLVCHDDRIINCFNHGI
ncbi:hypothetical protein GCM10007380_13830 [Gottfriedia solisilvae]|uniref:Uncharacterized protein n=1 Tax=Gottfriedia solisilvae TaxID=1516104 RepID=A0A8J3F0U2_9BACI|nr:hypothetical protein GCM10007380_13830 [Gottfriedia solisilvae]